MQYTVPNIQSVKKVTQNLILRETYRNLRQRRSDAQYDELRLACLNQFLVRQLFESLEIYLQTVDQIELHQQHRHFKRALSLCRFTSSQTRIRMPKIAVPAREQGGNCPHSFKNLGKTIIFSQAIKNWGKTKILGQLQGIALDRKFFCAFNINTNCRNKFANLGEFF